MSMVAAYSQSKQASNENSKPIKRPSAAKAPPQVERQNPALIIQRLRMHPESLTRDDVMQLQKTIGNRAVIKLLSSLNVDSKSPEEKTPMQMKKTATTEQSGGNKTGIPDNLKSGLEALSNVDLSDVRVHQNSDKPARLGALAYTQGNNIYVSSGQEKHLPHEGWHVVQQKQGRVKPTLQMKTGIQINDDSALEKEADLMGNRAVLLKTRSISSRTYGSLAGITQRPIIQTKCVDNRIIQLAKPQNKKLNTVLDIMQTIIDIVGFIPGIGDIADAINVVISLLRGDLLNAAFSAIAIIPGIGSVIAVPLKLIFRAANNINTIRKGTGILLKVFKNTRKIISVLDGVYNTVVGILKRVPDGIASLADNWLVKVAVGRPRIIVLANTIRKGLGNVFEKVNEIIDSAKNLIKKFGDEGAEATESVAKTQRVAGAKPMTWNKFQSINKGKYDKTGMREAWAKYKEANGIVSGTSRNQTAKSNFLKELGKSGKAPKWMNQWLSKGKVPPGYVVDHKVPLSIGGKDIPSNMRLLDEAFHKLHHSKGFYRPWQ